MGRGRVGRAPPFSRRVGARPDLRDEAPIWQKRFWEHHIRNDEDFAAHVRYCWINPVKHGLVGHPGEWPYSSWHRDAGERCGRAGRAPPFSRRVGARPDLQGGAARVGRASWRRDAGVVRECGKPDRKPVPT